MDERRISRMTQYVKGIKEGKWDRSWYDDFREDIASLLPEELFDVFTRLTQEGISADEILMFLDRVTTVIYNDMIAKPWPKPDQNSFLGVLMAENEGLKDHLGKIGEILKQRQIAQRKDELLELVAQLGNFEDHYRKKENILFPMMEKKDVKFEGVSIMWALHDQIREMLKETIALLKQDDPEEMAVNIKAGSLYFAMSSLVIKEEMILFPAASRLFDETESEAMYDQMFEYSFPFIPLPPRRTAPATEKTPMDGLFVHTSTGDLTFEQVEMVLNALPVDISFVDENNRLRYFSRPKDRFFPRSPAALGRDVKYCHPPKSVDKVLEIIDAFRKGEQSQASFWIHLKERFILIQYFAMRNDKGEYKGVLEVSQDITEIQKLEGDRRLASWGQ